METQRELEEEGAKGAAEILDKVAESVVGPWRGTSVEFILHFELHEAGGDALSGLGNLTEAGQANPSTAYTVRGTYRRPHLSLTFSGMTYQGRAVEGTFEANYDSIVGVGGMLHLRGTDYSKDISVLLQE